MQVAMRRVLLGFVSSTVSLEGFGEHRVEIRNLHLRPSRLLGTPAGIQALPIRVNTDIDTDTDTDTEIDFSI